MQQTKKEKEEYRLYISDNPLFLSLPVKPDSLSFCALPLVRYHYKSS